MRNNLYSVIAIAIVFNKYCSEYLILVRSPISHSLPQVAGIILLK
ncbi:hypothetical protein [Nostoc sp.]